MKERNARARVIAAAVAAGLLPCASAVAQTDTLKVASYNILHGASFGAELNKTRDVILASGADVVGIQEADGAADELAALLGWHYRVFSFDRGSESGFTDNTDTAILSRFPITQTLRSGIRIEIAPGKETYVFGAHLPAYPYQPYDIRDGGITTESQAIAAAQAARSAEVNLILSEMSPYVAAGKAVFLTGDMNEPSHLDWTTDAASAGKHAMKVTWPASTATTGAGFADSYRQIHPNEITHVGNTWTPMPGANEVHDRIDFVYSAGSGLSTANAQLVGESPANADIVISNYPSDHRAVVSTFNIPTATLAPVRSGVNLISNGGAEGNPGSATSADRILTDWESGATNNASTAQLYNKPGYASRFAASGWNHFYGGNVGTTSGEIHSITQTASVAQLASQIDASDASFILSGYFGGYETQNDRASLTSTFLNSSGGAISSVTIGNVTAGDRGNLTTLLFRSTSGTVPALTRDVRFTLTFTKVAGGTYNDGLADNLSFVINVPTPPTWNANAGGNWFSAGNWSGGGGVPNAVDAEARLNNAITAPHTVFADSPVTLGTLRINNVNTHVLAGAGSLTLATSTGPALVEVQAGTQKINLPLTIASDTNLIVSSGAALLIADPVTINAGKTLTQVTGTVTYQSTVSLENSAGLSVAPGAEKIIQIHSLSFAPEAKLDLADNILMAPADTLASVREKLSTARNVAPGGIADGRWDGQGIGSSVAAARFDTTGLETHVLGYALRSDALLVRYTVNGDADLDGACGFDDLLALAASFGAGLTAGRHWFDGDFNFDGQVDDSDVVILGAFYNDPRVEVSIVELTARYGTSFATAFSVGQAMSVPEPGLPGLIIFAGANLCARHRRRSVQASRGG